MKKLTKDDRKFYADLAAFITYALKCGRWDSSGIASTIIHDLTGRGTKLFLPRSYNYSDPKYWLQLKANS